MVANAPERARWNDERWLANWVRKERVTRLVTPTLIAAAKPRPGEAVLDIGCGSGGSTLAAARAVGFWGHVVGVDLSTTLLGRARTLAASFEEGMRARFVEADVQTDPVTGGPFDVALSQFGVMFFDDPDAAFSAVAGLLRPGGRLALAVWQAAERNPWNTGPVLRAAGVAPTPAPPEAGKAATGPFAWAEPDHARDLLGRAGFTDVAVTPHDRELDVTDDAVTGGGDLDAMGIPTHAHERARAVIADHLAPYRAAGGRLRLPMAFQIVGARRP
jgi:SAM-dependent methyltransferase